MDRRLGKLARLAPRPGKSPYVFHGKDHLCLFVCTCVALLALTASVALQWEKTHQRLAGVWPRPQFLGWAVLYLTLASMTQSYCTSLRHSAELQTNSCNTLYHDQNTFMSVLWSGGAIWAMMNEILPSFCGSYRWLTPAAALQKVHLPCIKRHTSAVLLKLVSCLGRQYFKTSQIKVHTKSIILSTFKKHYFEKSHQGQCIFFLLWFADFFFRIL